MSESQSRGVQIKTSAIATIQERARLRFIRIALLTNGATISLSADTLVPSAYTSSPMRMRTDTIVNNASMAIPMSHLTVLQIDGAITSLSLKMIRGRA